MPVLPPDCEPGQLPFLHATSWTADVGHLPNDFTPRQGLHEAATASLRWQLNQLSIHLTSNDLLRLHG